MRLRIFKCRHCGNVIIKMIDKGVDVVCCGEKMEEIVANTSEGATEKHLPLVNKNGDILQVKVGEALHPMEEIHFINFIAVEFNDGFVVKTLSPGNPPEESFY